MNLTWHGKDEAVKAARKTPYRLLRERAELSYPPREDAGATADSRQQTADSRQQTAVIVT